MIYALNKSVNRSIVCTDIFKLLNISLFHLIHIDLFNQDTVIFVLSVFFNFFWYIFLLQKKTRRET